MFEMTDDEHLENVLLYMCTWTDMHKKHGREYVDTHCWNCEAEVGKYEKGDTCPECGIELVVS